MSDLIEREAAVGALRSARDDWEREYNAFDARRWPPAAGLTSDEYDELYRLENYKDVAGWAVRTVAALPASTRYAELERAAREYQRAGAVFASVGYGAPHYDGQLHANAHGEYLRAIEAVLLAARNLDKEQDNG